MSRTERAALADRVRRGNLTIAPGVFDMVSARIADRAGFDALYMSGYGISASHLGLPDAGMATYSEMVGRASAICNGTSTALIADADTGFGGLLNVDRTVKGYEAAGVSAIQLEDQEFPKKCGHAEGRTVVPMSDMVTKIEVALDARTDENFLIIARTDARTTLGIDEAITRGNTYAAAGADVVFIESPENLDEFRRIAETVEAPLMANLVEGGFSPIINRELLEELGFAIAISPVTALLSTAALLQSVYRHLHEHGTSNGLAHDIMAIGEMHNLMGFDDVWEFDEKWGDR
ncbi:MAG: isocitrate lyase/PEP mutase family protein [Actinomycetia bacterium]|nr:isocitrate lyase/PEP mutase family protein [Actinomycetes bacterium]